MNASEIVNKVWNYAHVLSEDPRKGSGSAALAMALFINELKAPVEQITF